MAVRTPARPGIGRSMRFVWPALVTGVRQPTPRRLALTGVAVAGLVAAALLAPVPAAMHLRDWSEAAGPWFWLTFLAAHVVVTVFPFPRTVFTLAAGLLFGPWLGATVAVVASTISALAALLLVRAAGWQLSRLACHPRVGTLDARLRRRGWPAVVSLRLIPAVPFSVINYAAGASAVRVLPFTLATLVGLLPGTVAIVFLGNALVGEVSPALFPVSSGVAAVGVALLTYEVRRHRRHRVHAIGDGVAQPAEI